MREASREREKTIALVSLLSLVSSATSCAVLSLFLPSTSSFSSRCSYLCIKQGPQYVVTNFNIFVCTVCSGVQ